MLSCQGWMRNLSAALVCLRRDAGLSKISFPENILILGKIRIVSAIIARLGPKRIGALKKAKMKQIRIAIIDPRQLIREGFQKLLRRPLFDVVAAGKTLADAFGSAGMARADVVVLGHSTKTEVEAQIAALRHLPAEPHRPRFVLVTEIEEPDLLRQALASGVDALLSKNISSRVLQRSLELVALGQRLFPACLVPAAPAAPNAATPEGKPEPKPAPGMIAVPAPLASAMSRFGAQVPFTRPDAALPGLQGRAALSMRENQILGYLVRALPNKAIACELQITEATVKVHIKALLRKIRASNRTQAAIWALSHGRTPQATNEAADLPVAGMMDRHSAV